MDAVRAHPYLFAFAGGLLVWLWRRFNNDNPRGLPLPPGPKGLPLFGLTSIPTKRPWLVYDEWSKEYGDIMHFKFFGQSFIVLSSLRRTTDLFSKRSFKYSARPRMPMVVELMHSNYMPFLSYGPVWRRRRRAFFEHFHHGAIAKYQPIQEHEQRAFLRRLLGGSDSKDLKTHIRHSFAAAIMKIVYGIKVQEKNDPYITKAEEAAIGMTIATAPGRFLVDIMPILKYVPSWFPGAGFQKFAQHYSKVNETIIKKPFEVAAEALKNGTAIPSMVTKQIEKLPEEEDLRAEQVDVAQDAAAVAYLGGADTMISAMQTFFMAMAIYPAVQRKAQAELDLVIGPSRLPGYGDRPTLPYINAVVKEILRWQSVTPLGLPHTTSEADEYDGYFIPKGAIVMGNAWSILHDPEVFDNPEEFRPERYLKDGKLNPETRDPDVAGFGFGRRICPGRHFVDSSLFGLVSSTLAVYNIKPPVDSEGNLVQLQPIMTESMLSTPVPFECSIKPRSAAAEALIREFEETE